MFILQNDTESEAVYVDIDNEYKIIDMGALQKRRVQLKNRKRKIESLTRVMHPLKKKSNGDDRPFNE